MDELSNNEGFNIHEWTESSEVNRIGNIFPEYRLQTVRLRGLFMNFTSLIYVRILDNINNIKMVRGVAEIPDLFRMLNMISYE